MRSGRASMLARNLHRPRTLELAAAMTDDFVELHGDRLFGDDAAIVAGLARLDGRRIVVDRPAEGRRHRREHPAQLRDAAPGGLSQGDAADAAGRAVRPPGRDVRGRARRPSRAPDSEERGIAESIARSIGLMSGLRTPIVDRHHRRRRLRRRAGDRRRRRRDRARERGLLGHLARGLRVDPVAHAGRGARGRRSP